MNAVELIARLEALAVDVRTGVMSPKDAARVIAASEAKLASVKAAMRRRAS